MNSLAHSNWLLRGLPLLALAFALLFACADRRVGTSQPPRTAVDVVGPYAVGNTTLKFQDHMRDRVLVIEAWYPSADVRTPSSSPVNFETSETARALLTDAYESAPQCPTQITGSVRGSPLRAGGEALPLLLFSHCFNCGRYSSFSLAERLASHGFVVLSVDHAGLLPFLQAEPVEALSQAQLNIRTEDLRVTFEQAISGSLFDGSDILNELNIDAQKVGVYGHSFGSVTAGLFASTEPSVSALAGLAAPIENPLLPGVQMSDLTMPILLVLAEEDNSIGEIGNRLLRSNYEAARGPIWRVDIGDAGHWSVSDLCGLTEAFSAGCGSGVRHSDVEPRASFDYLPVSEGIGITQTYLTAFFLTHLMNRDDAQAYLNLDSRYERTTIHHRP